MTYVTPQARRSESNLQKLAYKWGAEQFGLSKGDFIIKFFEPNSKFKVKLICGSVIRIYFTIYWTDKEFDNTLRRALRAAAYLKSKKFPPPVLVLPNQTGDVLPKFAIPPLVKFEDLEITQVYKVVLKHKPTGMLHVKEGKPETTFTNLTQQARVELSDMVELLEQRTAEQSAEIKEVICADSAQSGGSLDSLSLSFSSRNFALQVYKECPKPFTYHDPRFYEER